MNKSLHRKIPYCIKCLQLMKIINKLGKDKYVVKCKSCNKMIEIEIEGGKR